MDLRDNYALLSAKERFRQQNIGVGTLVRSFVSDTNPPKIKYWLIVGYDLYDWAIIYLNTEIPKYADTNLILRDLQVEIQCDSRKLVEYNCYADCAQIKTKKISVVKPQLEENPHFVRGQFASSEMEVILAKIRASRSIAPALKARFGI